MSGGTHAEMRILGCRAPGEERKGGVAQKDAGKVEWEQIFTMENSALIFMDNSEQILYSSCQPQKSFPNNSFCSVWTQSGQAWPQGRREHSPETGFQGREMRMRYMLHKD